MQPGGVVPVNPAQGGYLDVGDGFPGPGAGWPVEWFGPVVAVDRIGSRVLPKLSPTDPTEDSTWILTNRPP